MAAELPLLQQSSTLVQVGDPREENLGNSVHCHVKIDQIDQEEVPYLAAEGQDEIRGLNEILGTSMPRLFRVADCVLHNYHDSEDALQDGLLSALRHIDQFKGNSHLSTWLYSIIRNSALGKLRKRRAHVMVSIDDHDSDEDSDWGEWNAPADPGPDPERGCAQSELSHRFASMLRSLPPNYRAIIRMCDFEGFSGKEAAQRLGLSVSALKAQHHRARLAIRQSMPARGAIHGHASPNPQPRTRSSRRVREGR